jgi:hypothetical protein
MSRSTHSNTNGSTGGDESLGRNIFLDGVIGNAIKRRELTFAKGYYGQVADLFYVEDELIARAIGSLLDSKLSLYVLHDWECEANVNINKIGKENPSIHMGAVAFKGLNSRADFSKLPHERVLEKLAEKEFEGNPRYLYDYLKINTNDEVLHGKYSHILNELVKQTLVMDSQAAAEKYRTAVTGAGGSVGSIVILDIENSLFSIFSSQNIKILGEQGQLPSIQHLHEKGKLVTIRKNHAEKAQILEQHLTQVLELWQQAIAIQKEMDTLDAQSQQAQPPTPLSSSSSISSSRSSLRSSSSAH